eukprot:tig00021073_g18088.t1
MATVRNANEIDPAKLAFEIDATAASRPKQGKAWSDEKKAFVMEENGGFYTLDLTDLSAVDGQTNPAADEFLKLLEALDAKFCEFVQQNQAKLKTMAGKRKTVPVVDMSNYLITERATIGTGDLVAALIKIDTAYAIPEGKFGLKVLAFKPYDNEADFEPYLNPESMYAAPMQ